MKIKIILFVLTLSTFASSAQQDAQYTQYMYNTINVNPAYAGSRGVLSVFGLHRTQWLGLDGAPVTNAFSINAPLGDSNLGAGLSFVNDRIGPTNENMVSADISYFIATSENFKLAFGLKGTANFFNLNVNKLLARNPADLSYQNVSSFSPNFGAGIYLYSNKKYFGISIPSLLQTNRYADNSVSVNKERFNLYVIGGQVFNLSSEIKLKPAFLIKATQGAPLQTDLSANFMFSDKLVLGGAYRWRAAVSLMTGFQVNESFYIGYGYDLETTRLQNYNSGSHEIFLRYEHFRRVKRIVSPRFF